MAWGWWPTSTTDTNGQTTTARHPWLTAARGWAQAGTLTVGERVLRADGSTATVVTLRDVAGSAPMYDLTVAQVHDFTVGSGAYVVHNCGGGESYEDAVKRANGDPTVGEANSHQWNGSQPVTDA